MRVSIILIALGLMLGLPTNVQAVEPNVKCYAAKVKETAKYYACRLKAESKAIKRGETPDFSKCDSKYGEKWAKAETKGEGECPTEGDQGAIITKMSGDSDTIVARLSGDRFVDNGDDTITDNQTGLMWEKKVSGSGCLHCLGDIYTWNEAMSEWISEVNGHTDDSNAQAGSPGGHTDWRLPTIVELQTIFDCSFTPCLDPIFGPRGPFGYWSSSTNAFDPVFAWVVAFGSGFVRENFFKTSNAYVRAVRGGQPGNVSADLTPGDHLNFTLEFDGETRLYDVHVPPGYDGASPVPLVLDLHGFRSSKTFQAAISGFKTLSDAEGFIVAYPQGLFGDPNDPEAPSDSGSGPCWNAGGCCAACTVADVDDVGFLRALVSAIAAEANIDLQRAYATGLSNGGAMAHRLACDAANVFAAVAPVAFPLPFDPLSSCQPLRPIPVLHFAGIDDVVVPFSGCSPETTPCNIDPDLVLSAATDSFTHWREVNGCISDPDDPLEEIFVQGTSMCETDTSCAGGVQVGLCSINGVDFAPWRGHVIYINEDGLNLAQIAWDFLSQF